MFNIFTALLLVGFTCVRSQEDPIVTIAQGDVRGTVEAAVNGNPFFSFRGIPYGQPPVGDLRFKAPLPASGWEDVFNATKDAEACTQEGFGQEDCLYLNVYTPQLPDGQSDPLPTMVFIHGGAFFLGSPSSKFYGPNLILQKDIILVEMAYRLGVFGFLSTASEAASGNYGLLDQNLALKWVRDNIAAFGGDPSTVTIFGESAGAASVSYHILSPVSSGLFRAAIQQSGSVFVPWGVQIDPLLYTVLLGEEFNCTTDDHELLLACLRNQTARDIVRESAKLGEYDVMLTEFLPVIEDPEYGQFITQHPLEILRSGNFNKIPCMAGSNKDEGDLPYDLTQEYFTTIDDHFFDVTLPGILLALLNYRSNLVNISYAIKDEYMADIDVNNQTQVIRTVIDVYSDSGFKAPCDMWIREMAANGLPTYMYVFEYAGKGSHFNFSGEPEVCHGDDLFYLFSKSRGELPILEGDDLTVSNAFVEMWTNFATNLDPNPLPDGVTTWNPTQIGEIQYLEFNVKQTMKDGYRTEYMDFWNRVVPEIAFG